LNVTGKNYLTAVKLEQTGKGPQLFCNKDLVEFLCSDIKRYSYIRKMIKKVGKEDIYEIVWPIMGCTTMCREKTRGTM